MKRNLIAIYEKYTSTSWNMNKDPLLLLLCLYVTMYLLVPYIKGMKYYEGM